MSPLAPMLLIVLLLALWASWPLICAYVLAPVLIKIAMRRPYHLNGYMDRGILVAPTNRWIKGWWVRVHVTKRSDEDRALHCHPGNNISLVLRGGYYEHMPLWTVEEVNRLFSASSQPERTIAKWRGAGTWVVRRGEQRHRLELNEGAPCVSLFIMRVGSKKREWGFYDWDRGEFKLIPWRDYLAGRDTTAKEDAECKDWRQLLSTFLTEDQFLADCLLLPVSQLTEKNRTIARDWAEQRFDVAKEQFIKSVLAPYLAGRDTTAKEDAA